MTLPRQIVEGRTYLVTRRTSQRMFLLLPSEVVEQVFLFCLAFAATRFGIEVHAFCVLSNHFHLVVTDTEGKLPRFMHWLNVHVAKLLNVSYRRGENFWANTKYSAVYLTNAEEVLDKIVYTICNPVSSWLVSRAERWPGLVSLPDELVSKVYHAIRPEFFFRERRDGCPQQVDLQLTQPAQFDDLDEAQYMALVAEHVREREQALRSRRRESGKGFLGRRRLARQTRDDTPLSVVTGASARKGISPRVACKDKWRRVERLQQLVGFRERYAVALAAWRAGARDVVFPAGTYLMRIRYGVPCVPT